MSIVHARENFVDAVLRLTGGRGVDVVYDGVGQATFAGSVEALAERGPSDQLRPGLGRQVGSFDIDALASKSATISRPNFGHYTDTPEKLAPLADHLFEALRRGIIVPTIGGRFPLAQAAEAHRRLESRETVGSLILFP